MRRASRERLLSKRPLLGFIFAKRPVLSPETALIGVKVPSGSRSSRRLGSSYSLSLRLRFSGSNRLPRLGLGRGDGDTAGEACAREASLRAGRSERQAQPRPSGGRWLIFTQRMCSVSRGKAGPRPCPARPEPLGQGAAFLGVGRGARWGGRRAPPPALVTGLLARRLRAGFLGGCRS